MTSSRQVDDFWSHVDRSPEAGCWLWLRGVDGSGYGFFRRDRAHRIAYRLTHGEIPDGLTIDHLCRTRRCVRPDHLEAVSRGENVRRGAPHRRTWTCIHGHPKELRGDTMICPTCNKRRRHDLYMRKRVLSLSVERTECRKGHSLTPDNVRVARKGAATYRECLTCARHRAAEWWRRNH